MSGQEQGGLKRSITLFAVIALGINGIIGQGIFLLPWKAAALLGPASLLSLAFAGLLSFLIALCFAEVASRFDSTGGAYLYSRRAFGDFVGFEVGWMTCIVALVAWASLATGFTLVLGVFVPEVKSGWAQKATAVGLITVLTAVNLRGAKAGANLSTVFSIAKLVPIAVFIAVGVFYVDGQNFEPFAPQGWAGFADATLIILYAYVGFEVLVVPAGEMQNPQRNVPLALILVLSFVTIVYVLVLGVAVGTFEGLPGHDNPVAAASATFMGSSGATLIGIGIVVSVFGTNAGSALVGPRRFYALAERGDLPPFLAKVNPDTGAPVAAILVTYVGAVALSLTGSFAELAALAVLARFVQYIPTCIALLVFRARDGDSAGPRGGFRLPLGPLFPLITVGLCLLLLYNSDPNKLLKGAIALGVGVPLYFLSRRFNWGTRGESGTHVDAESGPS